MDKKTQYVGAKIRSDVWREAKAMAVRSGTTTAQLLEKALLNVLPPATRKLLK